MSSLIEPLLPTFASTVRTNSYCDFCVADPYNEGFRIKKGNDDKVSLAWDKIKYIPRYTGGCLGCTNLKMKHEFLLLVFLTNLGVR
jgi:hypothetical protein